MPVPDGLALPAAALHLQPVSCGIVSAGGKLVCGRNGGVVVLAWRCCCCPSSASKGSPAEPASRPASWGSYCPAVRLLLTNRKPALQPASVGPRRQAVRCVRCAPLQVRLGHRLLLGRPRLLPAHDRGDWGGELALALCLAVRVDRAVVTSRCSVTQAMPVLLACATAARQACRDTALRSIAVPLLQTIEEPFNILPLAVRGLMCDPRTFLDCVLHHSFTL